MRLSRKDLCTSKSPWHTRKTHKVLKGVMAAEIPPPRTDRGWQPPQFYLWKQTDKTTQLQTRAAFLEKETTKQEPRGCNPEPSFPPTLKSNGVCTKGFQNHRSPVTPFSLLTRTSETSPAAHHVTVCLEETPCLFSYTGIKMERNCAPRKLHS